MTAQTTTQRTAKHRLAVKEKIERYERVLGAIAAGDIRDGLKAALIARDALEWGDNTQNTRNPTQRGS